MVVNILLIRPYLLGGSFGEVPQIPTILWNFRHSVAEYVQFARLHFVNFNLSSRWHHFGCVFRFFKFLSGGLFLISFRQEEEAEEVEEPEPDLEPPISERPMLLTDVGKFGTVLVDPVKGVFAPLKKSCKDYVLKPHVAGGAFKGYIVDSASKQKGITPYWAHQLLESSRARDVADMPEIVAKIEEVLEQAGISGPPSPVDRGQEGLAEDEEEEGVDEEDEEDAEDQEEKEKEKEKESIEEKEEEPAEETSQGGENANAQVPTEEQDAEAKDTAAAEARTAVCKNFN